MSKNVNDMNEGRYIVHLLTQKEPLVILLLLVIFILAIALCA